MRRAMRIQYGNYGDAGGDGSYHGGFRVYIMKPTISNTILFMFGTLAPPIMIILRRRVTAFDARAKLLPYRTSCRTVHLHHHFYLADHANYH